MSNRTAEVRPANLDDILGIRDTLEATRAVAVWPMPETEYPWALQYMMDLIAWGFAWVVVIDRQIVGVAMVDRAVWPWNRRAAFLDVVHLWIEPAYRTGGTGDKLLNAMRARADELALPLQLSITFPDDSGPAKDRWARMHGLKQTGGNFWYSPEKGS